MALYVDLQAELTIMSTSQTKHSDSVSQGPVWTGQAFSRVKVRKDEKRGHLVWFSAYVVCRQVGVSLWGMKLTLWENDQAKKMKYDVCLKLFFGVHISDKKVKDNFSGLASLSPLDCGAQSTRISGREDLKYNSPDDLQNINPVLKNIIGESQSDFSQLNINSKTRKMKTFILAFIVISVLILENQMWLMKRINIDWLIALLLFYWMKKIPIKIKQQET